MPLAGRRAGRASWEAMALVAMSRHLSFHARGDAVFVWHGLTGDVAEMSRDVLALLLAFDPRADEAEAKEAPPAGLARELVEEFVPVLRSRRFLVASAPRVQSVDEYSPLLAGYPRVPRNAVFHRRGNQVTVYGRGTPMELDARTALLFLRCDGERTLGQVLGDAGPAALPPLLRLARADVAALKVLAKAVSHGGVALNPAAESTMPYPELADPKAYAAGDPPQTGGPDGDIAGPDEHEITLAHLFRAPHPSLKGRTFGAALADGLLRRDALQHVKGRPARVLVDGGGPGALGAGRAPRRAAPRGRGVPGPDRLERDGREPRDPGRGRSDRQPRRPPTRAGRGRGAGPGRHPGGVRDRRPDGRSGPRRPRRVVCPVRRSARSEEHTS